MQILIPGGGHHNNQVFASTLRVQTSSKALLMTWIWILIAASCILVQGQDNNRISDINHDTNTADASVHLGPEEGVKEKSERSPKTSNRPTPYSRWLYQPTNETSSGAQPVTGVSVPFVRSGNRTPSIVVLSNGASDSTMTQLNGRNPGKLGRPQELTGALSVERNHYRSIRPKLFGATAPPLLPYSQNDQLSTSPYSEGRPGLDNTLSFKPFSPFVNLTRARGETFRTKKSASRKPAKSSTTVRQK
jgi:hypothetical protein